MNEYRRFVSYIYAYPGNVRDKNVGFAKVEVRNGQCRLDMTLNGVHMDTSKLYGVYMMVKDQEIEGDALVPLGEVLVNGGRGKYRDLLNPDNLGGSGYSIADGIGIAVADRTDSYYRMFSLWNDDEFHPKNVHFLQNKEKKAVEDSIEDSEVLDSASEDSGNNKVESESQNVETENNDSAIQEDEEKLEHVNSEDLKTEVKSEETENPESDPESKEQLEYQDTDSEIQLQNQEQEHVTEAHMQTTSFTGQRSKETEKVTDMNAEVRAASVPAKDAVRIEDALQWLIHRSDFIDAFDDDDLYECIEVTPEQLKKAFGNNEVFDQNSFMMHGFFRYRHLLLGRVQENDNNTQYFIGIPGMYCNRERYMASVFGFGNFKKSHRSDYNNPYFGYWYQEI
ncbi:MAG: hypothetical protein PHW47_04820 [Lachnospira sp.]|nr:hypothetical protein [Lachnospira sp.]